METSHTRYIVSWYVPLLAEWIKVGECRTEAGAYSTMELFRNRMSREYKSEVRTAITEVIEREVFDSKSNE